MSNIRRFTSVVLVAGGAVLIPKSGQADIIAASVGNAWDPDKAGCFANGWNEPGRVSFTGGCSDSFGLWDIPLPIRATGTKNMSVFGKSDSAHVCTAFVLNAAGVIVRFDDANLDEIEGWRPFAPLAVNSNETVVVECKLALAGSAWVSAVKGY